MRLISLQFGQGTDQLRGRGQEFGVLDLEPLLGTAAESFGNLAAVIKNLDLVVSCDTAIAHLAGALAARVWVALPLSAEWRWLMDRDDSPWYPTMKLFRQTALGNWEDVFECMAAELERQSSSFCNC